MTAFKVQETESKTCSESYRKSVMKSTALSFYMACNVPSVLSHNFPLKSAMVQMLVYHHAKNKNKQKDVFSDKKILRSNNILYYMSDIPKTGNKNIKYSRDQPACQNLDGL